MGLESNFQATVLEYLNSLPGCKAENVSGNANQSGRPDINGCYKGRMFKIELKTPDHNYKTSKKQCLELRKWRNVGCAVGVAYSIGFIQQIFSKPWKDNKTIDFADTQGSWFVIPSRNTNE